MTWIFTYRRVLSNQSEFLFRRMDQGNPAWADETATLEFFSKSFHIEPGKSGLSGTFSVAASKRSYQVFVVSVFRNEFFATVCSFLPVFKAIVTENVTEFRFRPS